MMKKEYTKPAAEVVNLNCSNDMMDDGTFTYSNVGTADGGGRAKENTAVDEDTWKDN